MTTRSPTPGRKIQSIRRQARQSARAGAPGRASAQAPAPARALPRGTAQTHQYGGTLLREPFSRRLLTVSANRIRQAARKDEDVAGSFVFLGRVRHKLTHFRDRDRRQSPHEQEQQRDEHPQRSDKRAPVPKSWLVPT